uniref:GIY-YIG domain-containing protein n=1 Tax=Lutzomyia longipalpis TaxID=7200 RepID=A0A1B0CW48_LUTLO
MKWSECEERTGQFFSKLKDPVPPDRRSNVVYRISCGACEGVYVGTTGRMLTTRVREHFRDCRTPIQREKAAASALCEHSHDTGHVFRFDEAEILDTHQHYGKRLMLEALHIKCNIDVAITTSAAKKLWEKGGPGDMKMPSATSGPLAPLQLHGGPEHQVWRDSTWSTQGEILTPRRTFQQAQETNSTGSTGILR